jgi:hypothetical protein
MLTLGLAAQSPEIIAGICRINAIAGETMAAWPKWSELAAFPPVPGASDRISMPPGVIELAYSEVPTSCLRSVYLAQAAINVLHKVGLPNVTAQRREDVVHP